MADSPRLTATHFDQQGWETQKQNHFEVQFEKYIDSDIRLLVVSFDLPRENTEVVPMRYFNQKVNQAGFTNFDTSSMVLRDAIGWDTEKKFLEWRRRVYDPENAIVGYAYEYKCKATVTEYSPNGEKARTWTLVGCWPQTVNYGSMSYENGGEKQLQVTIVYDYAYRSDI